VIHVSQEKICAPGDEIRATLSFRWPDEHFDAVMVELHRTNFGGRAFGNCIVLRGRVREPVLERESSVSLDLAGTVPHWVRSGTYTCRYVRCHVPGRGWVILFEDVRDVVLRVRPGRSLPPTVREGAEFLSLEIAVSDDECPKE
jgi:hypothetical protein